MTYYETPKPEDGSPAVRLDAGDGWQSRPAAEAALALVHTAQAGRFAPNLVVLTSRRQEGFGPQDMLEALGPDGSRPDLVAGELFTANLAGVPFAARMVSFTDPAAGTLAQLHVATAVKAEGDTSPGVGLVYCIGTVAGERAQQELPLFKEVLDTMQISA
jgi:hypothetical protein